MLADFTAAVLAILKRAYSYADRNMAACAVVGALLRRWLGSTNAALIATACFLCLDYSLHGKTRQLATEPVAAVVVNVQAIEHAEAAVSGAVPAAILQPQPAAQAAPVSITRTVPVTSVATAVAAAAVPPGLKLSMGGVICYANAAQPTPFHNPFCSGSMLFLCKTEPPPADPVRAAHFDGKTKMFEMQIQVYTSKFYQYLRRLVLVLALYRDYDAAIVCAAAAAHLLFARTMQHMLS
jgi:hypothetical protein